MSEGIPVHAMGTSEAEARSWLMAMNEKYIELAKAGEDFIQAIHEHKQREEAEASARSAGSQQLLFAGAHMSPQVRAFNLRLEGRYEEYLQTARDHVRELKEYLRDLQEGEGRFDHFIWGDAARKGLIQSTRKRIKKADVGIRYLISRKEELARRLERDEEAEAEDGNGNGEARRPVPYGGYPTGRGEAISPETQAVHGIHPTYQGPGLRPRAPEAAHERREPLPTRLYGYPGGAPRIPSGYADETRAEYIRRHAQELAETRPRLVHYPRPRGPIVEVPPETDLGESGTVEYFPRGKGFFRHRPIVHEAPPERQVPFPVAPGPGPGPYRGPPTPEYRWASSPREGGVGMEGMSPEERMQARQLAGAFQSAYTESREGESGGPAEVPALRGALLSEEEETRYNAIMQDIAERISAYPDDPEHVLVRRYIDENAGEYLGLVERYAKDMAGRPDILGAADVVYDTILNRAQRAQLPGPEGEKGWGDFASSDQRHTAVISEMRRQIDALGLQSSDDLKEYLGEQYDTVLKDYVLQELWGGSNVRQVAEEALKTLVEEFVIRNVRQSITGSERYSLDQRRALLERLFDQEGIVRDRIRDYVFTSGWTIPETVFKVVDVLKTGAGITTEGGGEAAEEGPSGTAQASIETVLNDLKTVSAHLGLVVEGERAHSRKGMLPVGAHSRKGKSRVANYAMVRRDHQRELQRVLNHMKRLDTLRLRILSNQSEFQKRLAISEKQLRSVEAHLKESEKKAAMLRQRLAEIGGPFPAESGHESFATIGARVRDGNDASWSNIETRMAEECAMAGAMARGPRRPPMELGFGGDGDDDEDRHTRLLGGYDGEERDEEAEDNAIISAFGRVENSWGKESGDAGEAPMPIEGFFDWVKKKRGKRQARKGLGAVEGVHRGQAKEKQREKKQVQKQTKQQAGGISKKIRALRKERSAVQKKGRKQARALGKEVRELRKRERGARKLQRGISATGANLSDHLVAISAAYKGEYGDEGDENMANPETVDAKVEHHATRAMAHLFDVLDDDDDERYEEDEEQQENSVSAGGAVNDALHPITKYVQAWADAAQAYAHAGAQANGDSESAEMLDEARNTLDQYGTEIAESFQGDDSEELQGAWRDLHERNCQLLDNSSLTSATTRKTGESEFASESELEL